MTASNDPANAEAVGYDGTRGTVTSAGREADAGVDVDLRDGADAAADAPPLADLIAFAVTANGVEFDVVSTGCTTRESVEAHVERVDADTVALTLRRVQPDGCRRMPFGLRVEFGREELGLGDEAIVLRNPLSRLPGRGRR